MSHDSGFNVNIDYPHSIKKILAKYSTKISVSRVAQYGVFGGYADHEAWVVSVYVITDVCRVCGLVRASIGWVSEHECCMRHTWDHAIALLLFNGLGDTIEEAMKDAGDRAEQFNEDPVGCNCKLERFLDRRQYLQSQRC